MESRLTPRQQECLRLVWERQATSKEIAAELGIRKTTVDSYIAEAVELPRRTRSARGGNDRLRRSAPCCVRG